MKSIAQNCHQDKVISASISKFFKTYRIGSILKTANAYKSKGFSAVSIFMMLFSTIFLHRSMYMSLLMGKGINGFGKDTAYRFMKSAHINWIHFTSLLSARIASESIEPLTDDKRINVLIVDDSMFSRSRSKKVELLAKVYDHAKGIYTHGFRMLTLCWSDGNTLLPVNGCLLSTENAKNRLVEAANFDKRTLGFKRRTLAQTKAPEVMLELLKQAKTAGIHASHVLFDTWFSSPSALLAIKGLQYDVIAMVKKTPKVHYLYNGKMTSVTEIYKQSKKRRGRSKYMLSAEIRIKKEDLSIPARLVYVRNRNKKTEYLVLISTDMALSEEEVIRIYGKRWGIEVFFKFCKSYLKLSKECNCLSYDAMTAHVAIVFTRYMMLAVENRQTADERSLGELFYVCTDEMADISWIEAFGLLIQLLQEVLTEELTLTEKEVKRLIDLFLSKMPKAITEKLINFA